MMIDYIKYISQIILVALLFASTINIGYLCLFIIPALCGSRKNIPKHSMAAINHFAILIPAHNESAVLRYLLQSLHNQDYPKDRYSVFVIADNCTDNTASIARQEGVTVLERFDDENRGKPYAIGWMLKRLNEMNVKYDAIVIFDADNLVAMNFLRIANTILTSGEQVFQGSVETKNISDSWVSISNHIVWSATNRIYQNGRQALGLGALLCGTGMGFSKDLIQRVGWDQTSLTEDREFTYKLLLAGIKVEWLDKAVVYDEKPIRANQAIKQQSRWASGMKMDFKKYFTSIFQGWRKTRDCALLDAIYNLIHPFLPGKGILTLLLLIPFGNVYLWSWWFSIYFLSLMYHGIGLAMNHSKIKYYGYLVIWPFSRLLSVFAALKTFTTRRNIAWKHTKHTQGLSLDDMNK